MAEHRRSNNLSPALEAVLVSLNVSLEAELNRYRRTRSVYSPVEEDIFAELDAVIEDSSDIAANLDQTSASLALTVAKTDAPPPLPPNKKLAQKHPAEERNTLEKTPEEAPARSLYDKANETPARASANALATQLYAEQPLSSDPALSSSLALSGSDNTEAISSAAVVIKPSPNRDYLDSSEKLLESLSEVASMPEPVDLDPEPKRKTVSLMAGAALGLLALIAGLGASYIMSTPEMAQTIAGGFRGERAKIDSTPQRTFDPPGPDLSAQEFVNIKLDNLSSLNMQPSRIDPLATSATPEAPALPPIESTTPPQIAPAANPSATQALSIPAGSNYYVTVPFSTEQGLLEVRKAVEEAFVRQFADGNRIQLAVFDNPETAQSFIAKIQTQGIQAQLYGPTAE